MAEETQQTGDEGKETPSAIVVRETPEVEEVDESSDITLSGLFNQEVEEEVVEGKEEGKKEEPASKAVEGAAAKIALEEQNRLLQEQRDQINFARVNAINETAFQNNLALSSYAFDRDLELAGDISKGNFIGSVLAGVADKVISSI